MKPNKNFIDGKWVASLEKETYQQKNPANLEQVTGIWPRSGLADVENAINAAQKTYQNWSALTVHKRAEYVKKALSLMMERVPGIAEVLTAENGKTLSESRLEIRAAINEMEFQISEGLYSLGE
ncbi:MAG: hypothetical protein DRQ58_11525, partial [Gammaproteobacteria bacterium]